MTRKDYIEIAAGLLAGLMFTHGVDAKPDAVHDTYCEAMANQLGSTNPAFKRDVFLKAAGHSQYI